MPLRDLFTKKKTAGPSQERIRQATTPKDEKQDAKDWGGKPYFNYRKTGKGMKESTCMSFKQFLAVYDSKAE